MVTSKAIFSTLVGEFDGEFARLCKLSNEVLGDGDMFRLYAGHDWLQVEATMKDGSEVSYDYRIKDGAVQKTETVTNRKTVGEVKPTEETVA